MKPTLVQMQPEMIEALDHRARADGVSRSQVIRDAVGAHLEMDARASLEARVERAYSKAPLDTPDEWGDVAAFLNSIRAARNESA